VRIQDAQLKRFITDSGLVSRKDIDVAEKVAKKKKQTLATALVSAGAITEDDLRRVESYVLGIPFVSLKDKKIDFSILSMIPEPVARKHNIIGYKKTKTTLEVAMLDTADLPAIDFIKKRLDLRFCQDLLTPSQ